MPRSDVILYREADGTVPLLDWLDGLSPKAIAKCRVRIERLAEFGHELRRPEADYLRDDIYEIRVRLRSVNYRMLYFFHGKQAVVLSHGLVKERVVPPREIDKAIARKEQFQEYPDKHSHRE